MKNLVLTIFLAGLCSVGHMQTADYKQLTDSCFHCLAIGDTLGFNRTYPQLLDAYERQADAEMYALRHELLSMRNQDQGIRLLLLEARKRYDSNSPTAQEIHARMKLIDTQNAVRVQKIIDQYGWPGKDDIGEEANETLFLCIQHVDDVTVQQKYLPILKHAVDDGAAEGWHYAFLVDRIRMNNGKKQIYGTQTVTKNNGELNYVVPLENPDKVDALRASVGLEPMKVYLDGEWDLKAYKRDLPNIERKYKVFTESRKQAN